MADRDHRISLDGKVLVDKIDAQLLEIQKQGQAVGFGVALTMGGRFHCRTNDQSHLPALQRRHCATHQRANRRHHRRRSSLAGPGARPHTIGLGPQA